MGLNLCFFFRAGIKFAWAIFSFNKFFIMFEIFFRLVLATIPLVNLRRDFVQQVSIVLELFRLENNTVLLRYSCCKDHQTDFRSQVFFNFHGLDCVLHCHGNCSFIYACYPRVLQSLGSCISLRTIEFSQTEEEILGKA